MKRLSHLTLALTAASLAVFNGAAAAQQDYPLKPIRIVVAYPPGGSNDFLARLFGPKLTETFGRQVVIDNRGGGNTIIGTEIVAKAAPDGYTLLLAGSTMLALPHLFRFIPYDTMNDLIPIVGIARAEFLLVVHPSLPVTSVQELIALAKQKPGQLNYATSSTGGPTHLGAVQFEMLTATKMQQVPYRGGGPAMADLVGGQVQLGFANPAGAMAMVHAGRLRPIAITGDKRLPVLPQVPTFAEAGLPGLVLRNWYSITGPAGVPKAVTDKLMATVMKISALPEVRAAIVKQGLDSYSATGEQLNVIRREDTAIVAKVIKAANIKPLD